MRRSVLAAGIVAATAIAAFAVPMGAQASTNVTFTITAGTLSITEPSATAALGATTPSVTGNTVTGSLGSTVITDTRGSLAGWTLSIAGPSGSGFTDGATQYVPASAASIFLTALPTITGLPVIVNTHVAAATGLNLTTAAQSFMTATTVGSNSATFNPSVQITAPVGAVAGNYAGTITQTVM